MINENKKILNLYQPTTYQIIVPGHLDEGWADWVDDMKIASENTLDDLPITTLTAIVDQAALLGLLRRLYSVGLPLISVNCLEV